MPRQKDNCMSPPLAPIRVPFVRAGIELNSQGLFPDAQWHDGYVGHGITQARSTKAFFCQQARFETMLFKGGPNFFHCPGRVRENPHASMTQLGESGIVPQAWEFLVHEPIHEQIGGADCPVKPPLGSGHGIPKPALAAPVPFLDDLDCIGNDPQEIRRAIVFPWVSMDAVNHGGLG